MKYSFHPEAESELSHAIDYYEERQENLGYDFSLEVYLTIRKILEYPSAWPVIEGEIRRCLINRFPFGVLYSMEEDEVFILAVMHLHRDPDYWKSRLQ